MSKVMSGLNSFLMICIIYYPIESYFQYGLKDKRPSQKSYGYRNLKDVVVLAIPRGLGAVSSADPEAPPDVVLSKKIG